MVKLLNLTLDEVVAGKPLRRMFDKDEVARLAKSLKKHGVLEPIVVKPREDGQYTLVAGGLRLRAAKAAGLETIPATVINPKTPEDQTLEMALAENVHRQALNPYDEAETYKVLQERGVKQKDLAVVVGKRQPYVAKRLRLLKLHPKVRENVRRGIISPAHGQSLLRLKDSKKQMEMAKRIAEEKLSEKETRGLVRQMLGKKLKCHLVPLHLSIKEYAALEKLAPKGDVKKLILNTVTKLIA